MYIILGDQLQFCHVGFPEASRNPPVLHVQVGKYKDKQRSLFANSASSLLFVNDYFSSKRISD